MQELIQRLTDWVRVLFGIRARGRHRACPAACTPRAPRTSRPLIVRAWAPPYLPASPYGRAEPLFYEDPDSMVRPYVLRYEQQRQERRRQRDEEAQQQRALLLTLDGVDVGPEWIHGVRVGVA